MPTALQTGTRIRERRLILAIRQADLAQAAGISPSYLNLIEHNKRRIGGKLLADLARALSVDPAALAEGADGELLEVLRLAAATGGGAAELERIDSFVTRYPGWAALVAEQGQQIAALTAQLKVQSDRIAHDPQLSTALHDVISAVTSIRSTADILVGDDRLDADWQRRFHNNIHVESLRLAGVSEALMSYLAAPKSEAVAASSPMEEVEAMFVENDFVLSAFEADPNADIDGFVARQRAITTGAGGQLARRRVQEYATLSGRLPNPVFSKQARALAYDPLALSQHFNLGFADILRRLASLSVAEGHPPMGLAVCDAAGAMTFVKPVPGFVRPRSGAFCPLWPLFSALSQPGRPVRAEVVLPDPVRTRLLCYAIATPLPTVAFDQPATHASTMLVLPDPPEGMQPPHLVGTSCAICPRNECVARRVPSALTPRNAGAPTT